MANTPQLDRPSDKRIRILRAAEMVFAQKGFHGTTMRTIAEASDIKLSLIVYHFETKLGLYRQIFLDRQYVNDSRRQLVHSIDESSADALTRLVSAFTDPVLELHRHPNDIWFARLVLREAADPSSQDRKIIHELFDPMATEFIDALSRINPGRETGFYRWAYLFAVGVLTSSSFDVRAQHLGEYSTQAEGPASDKARYLREFIASGWKGVR